MLIIMPAKVGIKTCRFARECVSFVHAYLLFKFLFNFSSMYVCMYILC